MEVIQYILTAISLITGFGSVCVLVYGFGKFLNKPQDTLAQRVTVLETKQEETERRLTKGTERFKENNEASQVMLKSLIALIEFEIQNLTNEGKEITPGLERAKNDLNEFLIRK